MAYNVDYKTSAFKDLKRLSLLDSKNIISSIDNILVFSPGKDKELKGKKFKGFYSYRVNDYRVIYIIEHDVSLIYVIAISHRKEVYKLLDRRI
ncbi:MAG: type II toxin-antitoxin system RelE/ParE family toxin [Candidatus Sericytochromatia bacterium]|nr:type II toxin-antitoxin system RelE/ParE family toxin [Candidatus Sericytochromatia bacterium]